MAYLSRWIGELRWGGSVVLWFCLSFAQRSPMQQQQSCVMRVIQRSQLVSVGAVLLCAFRLTSVIA